VTLLAPLLEGFFLDRLMRQRRVSENTIAAYRDTFRLLLRFAAIQLGKPPAQLELGWLDATFIGDFLDHLEIDRRNSIRTRNARHAALCSFFRYAVLQEPAHAALIQRVLAIPQKRANQRLVTFLTELEVKALLAVPDTRTWLGRRDHTLLLVAIETGLRVSELTGLGCEDVVLGPGAHVRCRGKGRKERCTPLRPPVTRVLKAWLQERCGVPSDALFPSLRTGGRLSRDAVERLLTKYANEATKTCTSLKRKRVSPHVLRHTTAVNLLRAGVDRSTIALWLGHEQVETTQMYLAADLSMKERALARTAPLPAHVARYRPDDQLLAFLQRL
jgi:site-specific recombinase XerD